MHENAWRECTRCEIGKTAFRHVFARGTIPCDVLFVGEAPGKTEDATGLPFVGKSGKLLDEWIAEAFLTPSSQALYEDLTYAVTNTVLCRPCDHRGAPNRGPSLQEKKNCRPRFEEFLRIARPRAVVLVGKHAQEITLPPGYARCEIYHPMAAIYAGGRGSRVDLEQRAKLKAFIQREYVSWQKFAV